MKRVDLPVERRSDIGTGPSKRLRENGYIPGVVYGSEMDTIPIIVSKDDFWSILRDYGYNCIINFIIDDEEEIVSIIKDIQMDYLSEKIIHLDFLKISLDEPITVEVPISGVGDPVGVDKGGLLEQGLFELEIKTLPESVPDQVEIDVSDLDFGDAIYSGDLELPEDVELISSPDIMVFTVSAPSVVEIEVPEEEELLEEELEELEEVEEGEEVEEVEDEGDEEDEEELYKRDYF